MTPPCPGIPGSEATGPYNRRVPRKPATKTAKKAAPGPSGAKSARTRERILDAAAAVLSRKGYAGTRLTDVAEQAEVQAPAIYYYYPSREDLIEEVMWVGIAQVVEHIEKVLDALEPGTSPLDRIDAAVEAHLRYGLEISDYTSAAIRNAGQVPDELRVRYDAESVKYNDIWRRLIKNADDAGDLRDDLDLTVARLLVLGALNWSTEWWDPKKRNLDTIVKTAQSLVRHGLAVPPKPARATARKK